MKKLKGTIVLLFIMPLLILFISGIKRVEPEMAQIDSILVKVIDTIPAFLESDSPSIYLFEALKYYEVAHPEIVYAQAILETGHFKSNLAINSNNLFGLFNSYKMQFFKFKHWTGSIQGYLDFVQYKYKPPENATDEDYYKFLKELGYAKDPNYINKLRVIVKRNQSLE